MIEEVSYCGLDCKTCPIYLASRENDETKKGEMIYEIILACKKHYGNDYKYEDINECDGCKSESGRLFFGCSDCKIRKCAGEREIENCANCEEYACENLIELFKSDPSVKIRLDRVRATL